MAGLELELTDEQGALLEARLNRSFDKGNEAALIYRRIENASTTEELENIAREYRFCDKIELSGIDRTIARKVLRVLLNVLVRFPKLAGRLNYVGTYREYEAFLSKMGEDNMKCVREVGLQEIFDESMARTFGKFGANLCKELWAEDMMSLSAYVSMGGLCNGLLFDSINEKDFAYLNALSIIRKNEQMGFHPKGCNGFESVAYHEIGHMVDEMCFFSFSEEGSAFLAQYSSEEIAQGLSRYATASPQECVAEAVAEVFSSLSPRRISMEIYDKICKKYFQIDER